MSDLSPAEVRAMELVCRGMTIDEIAGELGVTHWTVRKQLSSAYRHLGAVDRGSAAHQFTKRAAGKCGCSCRCHADEAQPEWPGACAACCEPGMNCDCGRAMVIGLREAAHKAAEIGFTYGALGRDMTYVYRNVDDMLKEARREGSS